MRTAGDVSIHLRVHPDGVVIAVLTGDLDRLGAPALEDVLAELLADRQDFVLDLRGLGFLGVAGLEVLLNTARATTRCGVSWAVVTWGSVVNRAIEALGVSGLLPVHPTLIDALAEIETGRAEHAR
ncbi:STAS domain-containing protein [Amycolatopsis lurida]